MASICEVFWTYSLKFMVFKDLKLLRFTNFFKVHEGLPILAPFLGYLAFGFLNIVLFSQAIKTIPTATAFGVWTAATLIFLKLADTFYFHQKTSFLEVLFLILIFVGIIGLKLVNDQPLA